MTVCMKLYGALEAAEALARRVACPICQAPADQCCRGGHGQALAGAHLARWERAVAAPEAAR